MDRIYLNEYSQLTHHITPINAWSEKIKCDCVDLYCSFAAKINVQLLAKGIVYIHKRTHILNYHQHANSHIPAYFAIERQASGMVWVYVCVITFIQLIGDTQTLRQASDSKIASIYDNNNNNNNNSIMRFKQLFWHFANLRP